MASALVRNAKKPCFATANGGGALPSDVLYEVLLRLPAKALCRLRLVCRSWRSLTSDPGFAIAHSSRHPLLVGLDRRHDAIHIVDLYSCDVDKRIHLGGYLCWSLNTQAGLICAAVVSTPLSARASRRRRRRDHVLVINPTTGAVIDDVVLPDGGDDDMIVPDASTGFVLIRHVPVLGHVPSIGDYKVLRFSCHHYSGAYAILHGMMKMVCEVMTLGGCDKAWRAKPCPVQISGQSFEGQAVVHGVAYVLSWEFTYGGGDSDDGMQPNVAMFDLATEEWRPKIPRGPLRNNTVDFADDKVQSAGLHGCLVIVHHKRQDCSTDLWFLTDVDNGIWTKRYSMRGTPHWEPHDPFHPPLSPLVVLDDGWTMVAWLGGQHVLKSYDARKDAWVDLGSLEYYCIEMYQGSLLGA